MHKCLVALLAPVLASFLVTGSALANGAVPLAGGAKGFLNPQPLPPNDPPPMAGGRTRLSASAVTKSLVAKPPAQTLRPKTNPPTRGLVDQGSGQPSSNAGSNVAGKAAVLGVSHSMRATGAGAGK